MYQKQKKYRVEDFIADASKLLDGIPDVDGFLDDLPTERAEELLAEIRKKSLESVEDTVDLRTHGYAEISVSDDEMRVGAAFFPPTEGMEPLSPNDVAKILSDRGISKGVDWDRISEAVFKCNTEIEPVTDVVIASGTPPFDEIPEHLEIEPELLRKKDENQWYNDRVDFKKISPFVLVKKGEILAHLVPTRPGKLGSTVNGKSLPYKKAKIAQLKPGKNTQEQADAVVASCEGIFEYDNHEFWVNEVLEISHDIDYSTGHIDFPGDVIIRGEIHDGFKVRAGGSIYCARTMDASEVVCGKDVIVQQGIIGKREGVLKTEGRVKAKFIENCYVQAKGTISVEVGIMNSSVHTLDRVELGFKGVITGGKTYAQNGVTATQLGSQSGTRTEIYCGIDFSIEQKLEWIRDKNIEIAMKLNRVREEIKRSPENRELLKFRDKLQAAIHRMNEVASTLIHHLDRNEEVEIQARANVFPGVYIEICHVSYIVKRKLNSVCFKLDKSRGKIGVEPLARSTRSP